MMAATRVFWPVEAARPGSWWWAGAVVAALAAGLRFGPARPRSISRWLALAGFSVLLAAMFWAANRGLDLLAPPGSRRHDAASTIAGFELWALLCPGLTIVALAGALRSGVRGSRR